MKYPQLSAVKLLACLIVHIIFLTGCNVTPANKSAILQIEQGQFLAANKTIKDNYSATGKERLLYELELATVSQLSANYLQSNQHLSKAKSHIESFYTISVSEQALALLSGPSYSVYEGHAYYLPLIHYMMALNFNALAQQNPSMRQDYLDSAQVEMRQLDVYLSQLKNKPGGYKDKDSDESTTSDILKILQPILAPNDLLKNIEYKDDAFAHFFSGLISEQNNELDTARIQFQRANQAFTNGYTRQFSLSDKTKELTRISLARVMANAGGYERELEALKEQYNDLKTSSKNQLTVIQDVGIAPEKKQFNLLLRAEKGSKSLVMYPIFIGTAQEKREQQLWFQMLYADTSLFDMIQNYMLGDFEDVILGAFTKRIPLGSLWDDAEDMGLIDALEYGGRISVSYLAPPKLPIKRTEIWQNNKKLGDLALFQSVSQLALQQALSNAQSEIRVAFTRELVKALTAQKAIQSVATDQNNLFGSFLKIASTAVNAITASADTRQWQSLPAQIRVAQMDIDPGLQNLTIKTTLNSGRVIQQSAKIDIKDSMTIWHTRTFLNTRSMVNDK